jgi:cytoskeletal protein RodZ
MDKPTLSQLSGKMTQYSTTQTTSHAAEEPIDAEIIETRHHGRRFYQYSETDSVVNLHPQPLELEADELVPIAKRLRQSQRDRLPRTAKGYPRQRNAKGDGALHSAKSDRRDSQRQSQLSAQKRCLDILTTPWGMSSLFLLLVANILLSIAQLSDSSAPTTAAQPSTPPTSPTQASQTPSLPTELTLATDKRKSLDIASLSLVAPPATAPANTSVAAVASVAQPTTAQLAPPVTIALANGSPATSAQVLLPPAIQSYPMQQPIAKVAQIPKAAVPVQPVVAKPLPVPQKPIAAFRMTSIPTLPPAYSAAPAIPVGGARSAIAPVAPTALPTPSKPIAASPPASLPNIPLAPEVSSSVTPVVVDPAPVSEQPLNSPNPASQPALEPSQASVDHQTPLGFNYKTRAKMQSLGTQTNPAPLIEQLQQLQQQRIEQQNLQPSEQQPPANPDSTQP